MTSNPGLLRIGLFNTRSVRNKLHHIAETLNEFDLDILCLTEIPDDSQPSQRNEGPQQGLPENQDIILPRRSERLRNRIMRNNTPGD